MDKKYNGLCVIGRAERMGLGSMTEDFCQAMKPSKILIIDHENGRRIDTSKLPGAQVVRVSEFRKDVSILERFLQECGIVVGFESFYRDDVPAVANYLGLKSVIFPMWEWSPLSTHEADLIIALSETDHAVYPNSVRIDWPISSEVHDPNRIVNWPPKAFVHIAGNARHNRDGTREVLDAARCLEGTGATLYCYHSFSMPDSGLDCVRMMGATDTRKSLYEGKDCMVCPRGLAGHSLPIHEAVGEGIPVIVLDLPDFAGLPYKVGYTESGFLKCRTQVPLHSPNVKELGWLMRAMALGKVERFSQPSLPMWSDFKRMWNKWLVNGSDGGGYGYYRYSKSESLRKEGV